LTLYYRRVQDKEMVINYDSSSQQFYYPASQVAHQFGSSDANNVYLTADTSAGIEFLTSPGRSTRLDSTFSGGGASMDVSVTSSIDQWARVVINGIDSGKVVTTAPASGDSTVAVSATPVLSTDYDAGTEVKFYNPAGKYESTGNNVVTQATVGGVTVLTLPVGTGAGEITFPNYIAEGQYLWYSDNLGSTNPTSSAARITGVNSTTGEITLDVELDATAQAAVVSADAGLLFYDPISYALTAQDGSKVVMKGDIYNATSSQEFYAVTTQYEVYGQLDNQYFNNTDPAFNSRDPQNLEATIASSYDPIAVMSFWGGKNIDSLVYDAESGDAAFKSSVTLNSVISTTGTADPQNMQALSFDVDLTGTRNYATPFSVDLSTQDGSSVAQINAVTVDKEGKIVGSYGDGRQYISGQLALVQFNAVNDLVAVGGNVFMAKAQENPGIEGYIVGKPGTKGLGEIRASAVEASNVDLTNELVKLMQMQRMYSANSQSVRAFDDTLSTTIRMTGG